MASHWHLDTSWPTESDFDRIISWANGLFIFVKTLVHALGCCEDPEVSLKVALQQSAGTGLESLYALYSSILRALIVHKSAKFRQVIGVLLTSSPYCDCQVDIQNMDVQLGIACLRVMTTQLHFNICKLEDSQLPNANIRDLPFQVKQNVSDPLQYSCLHWSNHLCSPSDNRNQCVLVLGSLKEFFEGLYPLFWVEVLSILGMVSIGAPNL